jgi:uncharacterized protein (TIGR00369 family)
MKDLTSQQHAHNATMYHQHCAVCGSQDHLQLGLQFSPQTDGSMRVTFKGGERFQGYRDRMHGGVLATIIDAAMTHCLFANGMAGVTADLHLRYLHPVNTRDEIEVSCVIRRHRHQVLYLSADVQQENDVKVRAEGRFWEVTDDSEFAAGEQD